MNVNCDGENFVCNFQQGGLLNANVGDGEYVSCFKTQIFSVESFKGKLVWKQGVDRGVCVSTLNRETLSALHLTMCKVGFEPSPLPLPTDDFL